MMIVPILTYQSTFKITFTNTQKKMLKSLQRRASVIVGHEIPSVIQVIHRGSLHPNTKMFGGWRLLKFYWLFHSQQTLTTYETQDIS